MAISGESVLYAAKSMRKHALLAYHVRREGWGFFPLDAPRKGCSRYGRHTFARPPGHPIQRFNRGNLDELPAPDGATFVNEALMRGQTAPCQEK